MGLSPGEVNVVPNNLPKLICVLEGGMRHEFADGTAGRIEPGSVIVQLDAETHFYRPPEEGAPGSMRCLRITFTPEIVAAITRGHFLRDSLLRQLMETVPRQAILPPQPGLGRWFGEMRDEMTGREMHRRERVTALLNLLLVDLIREAREKSPAAARRATAPARQCERIAAYLEEHLEEPLTLADIARVVDRSEEHVARLFRAERGVTVFRELQRLRLEKARYLLLCSDASISEIAAQCGFQTLAHFSRSFREHYKTPPSQYRTEGMAIAPSR